MVDLHYDVGLNPFYPCSRDLIPSFKQCPEAILKVDLNFRSLSISTRQNAVLFSRQQSSEEPFSDVVSKAASIAIPTTLPLKTIKSRDEKDQESALTDESEAHAGENVEGTPRSQSQTDHAMAMLVAAASAVSVRHRQVCARIR